MLSEGSDPANPPKQTFELNLFIKKNVNCIMPRDHLSHTEPAERSEGGTDMVIFAQPGNKARREMYDALQSVQA